MYLEMKLFSKPSYLYVRWIYCSNQRFVHFNGRFEHFHGRFEPFHGRFEHFNARFEHFNAQCFASTTSSSSHRPFLPRSESPWPGRFFPSFLSFPCHSSFSLFLYLLLFLPPSPRLPLSLPLSFLLSFPLSVSLWPSLFPLLNSLSVIRRVELSVCPPDNVGQSQAVLRSN